MNPYHVFLHINQPETSFVQKQRLNGFVAFILNSVKKLACLPAGFISQASRYFDWAFLHELPELLMDIGPCLTDKIENYLNRPL